MCVYTIIHLTWFKCTSLQSAFQKENGLSYQTKLGTHILYSIVPAVKRSRSVGNKNRHGHTVASDACYYGRVLLLPAWVCMSIQLPMFSSYMPVLCSLTKILQLRLGIFSANVHCHAPSFMNPHECRLTVVNCMLVI